MIRSLTRPVLAVAIAFGAATVTTPTASHAQSSESLAQLQTELDALDTMTDNHRPHAQERRDPPPADERLSQAGGQDE